MAAAGRAARPALRRLEDSGGDVAARAVVDALDLPGSAPRPGAAGPRPRVVAVMIGSIDGRATVDGRSVGLGHPEDRALLRGVRAASDAVLAGTRTIAAEGYANLLDPDERDRRIAAGRPPHPRVVTVSRDGSVAADDAPVYGEDGVPVTVYTRSATAIAGGGSGVEVVPLGDVSFPALLADLHARHGVTSVACEGGPGLLRELVAQGCLDELLLTVAPLLVAGDGPTPLTGDALPGGTRMRLADIHRADDHLFLHYVS